MKVGNGLVSHIVVPTNAAHFGHVIVDLSVRLDVAHLGFATAHSGGLGDFSVPRPAQRPPGVRERGFAKNIPNGGGSEYLPGKFIRVRPPPPSSDGPDTDEPPKGLRASGSFQ